MALGGQTDLRVCPLFSGHYNRVRCSVALGGYPKDTAQFVGLFTCARSFDGVAGAQLVLGGSLVEPQLVTVAVVADRPAKLAGTIVDWRSTPAAAPAAAAGD